MKKKYIASGVIFLIILSAAALFYRNFQNPSFCASCHYMKPYYDGWNSSQHNNVKCLQCHDYSVLKIIVSSMVYFMGYYNPRPIGDVKNESCMQLGCHNDRMVKSVVVFSRKINFDHAKHMGTLLRGEMLRCSSCHSQIVHGDHLYVSEEICFLCHFKGMPKDKAFSGCPSCHGVPEGEVEHGGYSVNLSEYIQTGIECSRCHTKVVSGDGKVNQNRCYSCHPERMEKFDDHKLIHDKHVSDKGIDCFYCHEEIRHGNVQMAKPLEVQCDSCHKMVHGGQKEIYMGVMAKGVQNIPSRMFAAQVSCDGCHTEVHFVKGKHVLGEAMAEANEKSCLVCHEKGYDLMLRSWEANLGKLVAYTEKRLKSVSSVGKLKDADKKEYDDVSFNLDLLKRSNGIHNVEYAVRILRNANKFEDRVLKGNGRNKSMDELLEIKTAYCTTFCHNYIKNDSILDFNGNDFPHEKHISDFGLDCTDCHSAEKHKTTSLTLEECAGCHHNDDNDNCRRCHIEESALYFGLKQKYITGIVPDVMAVSDVSCTDCHSPSQDSGSSDAVSQCKNCHSEEYVKMPEEWELKSSALNENIGKSIERINLAFEDEKKSEIRSNIILQKKFVGDIKVYNFLKKGKIVHNFPEALSALESLETDLNEILKKIISVTENNGSE